MTVLTQLSVGAFATIWLLQLLGASTRLGIAALTSLARRRPGAGGLDAAPGPADSRLSRAEDVAALVAEPRGAAVRRVLGRRRRCMPARCGSALPGSVLLGALTALLGIAGVTASACIYRVPSRPAWNTPLTLAAVQPHRGAARAAVRRGGRRRRSRAGWRWRRRRWPARSCVLLALRFLRCIASDSLELQGTARLLSTVLAHALRAARRACWRSAASCCRCSSPAVSDAGSGASRWRSCSRSPARCSAATCSSSASFPSTWPPPYLAVGKRGRMNLKRLLGLDTRADRYAYGDDPVAGLRLGAEGAGTLGGDHLRLLLGRLRHVHRRQGRPRGQRARQSGSSGEPRACSARRACRSITRSTPTTARAIRCCARRTASSRVSWDDALDDDGARGSATCRRGTAASGRRHQHRPARDRGVLHARQAGAARPRHAQLRRQHDAVHVHGGGRLQAVVRQRRPARRLRGPREAPTSSC